ncbi:tyrosine-type recombinase/integrase, partial [Pseudolactococcus yaeyamensis]
ETQVKISTFTSLSFNLRKQLTYFHGRKLSELSALDIHAFQQYMLKTKTQRGKPASISYVNRLTTGLSSIFERAIVYELMTENWVRKVGKLRETQKKKIEFWTMDEYRQFEATLPLSTHTEMLQTTGFRLLFMTGMRIGEMLALNWEQIDFSEQMITIEKTLYYRSKTENQLLTPKTEASRRRIGVDGKTLQMLLEWREKQGTIGAMAYVCQIDGSFMCDSLWSAWLKCLSIKANVQPIKLHSLRHSHASMLISIGESPLVIQKRLGHHDIKMTLGTYGHLYPDASQKLTEKLSLLEI